jgi:hypothetical protein
MLTRINHWLSMPRGFYTLISVMIMAHLVIRGFLYSGAPTDDAEQMLFSQVFRWGYDVVNPPLYTWLVIAVQHVVGVENWSVSLIKFPAYWLIFHFLYVLARRIVEDNYLAALAALSPLWLYYVAWDAVLSYSHTVLATALILAALVGLLRLQENRSVASYLLLGVIFGLGILSKYTFGLALMAMLIAGILHRPFRSYVVHPYMVLTLLVAAVIISPHVNWLTHNTDLLGTAVSGKFEIAAGSTFLEARLKGFGSAIASGLGFGMPLWLILILAFSQPLRRRLKTHEYISSSTKVLTIFLFVALIMLALFILIAGVTKIRAHYMFVLIPFPIVFFAWIKPELKSPKSVQYFGLSLVIMSVLMICGMTAKYISEPIRCKRCQLLVPYKEIGASIREIGFKGGTIFGYYFPHDLAGNLRTAFPDTRIVSTKYPDISRPLKENTGQCLIIWMPAPGGVMDAEGMSRLANRAFGSSIPLVDYPEKSLTFEFDRTTGKTGKLSYMLFSPGLGTCR